ncbi:hypothetical protein [Conexibacter sp. SYSU D00693]|uniref:hypothetical protein n=1 Tax=Conexibacter sp. SYSU D00693 TaxID=2812560 RepID=UPI00196B4583|nr:hypothetical protein [Conexibacter sp. SYSU D00693]
MSRTSSPVATGLLALGVLQLLQGLWMAVDPGSFFDTLGAFGARNDHYVRDAATPTLALGGVALAAVSRPSWRAPVLAFAALWFGLHAVNHLADVSDANADGVGPLDLVLLAGLTAGLAWLAALARREEPAG